MKILLLPLLLLTASNAQAMFARPQFVPVDRLAENAKTYSAAHPDDAEALYILARIHYLAFSLKRDHIPELPFREGDKPNPAPQWMVGWGHEEKPGHSLNDEALLDHAVQSIQAFQAALQRSPKNGLYALGLASLEEELIRWRKSADGVQLPSAVKEITEDSAREWYAKAFTLAMPADSRLKNMPLEGVRGITAFEAASGLVRMGQGNTPHHVWRQAKSSIEKFQTLPMREITPIVFSLRPGTKLAELIDAKRTVDFDLRGYGTKELWPWVQPELGFLVWDPAETGVITSARQMFGSYTFQIFWRDGYQALAALDDNRDGVLSGPELQGIRVWFDLDRDAKSNPGEVLSLEKLQVDQIATVATAQEGDCLMNRAGIRFRDGTVLPTWDWVVSPVR